MSPRRTCAVCVPDRRPSKCAAIHKVSDTPHAFRMRILKSESLYDGAVSSILSGISYCNASDGGRLALGWLAMVFVQGESKGQWKKKQVKGDILPFPFS